MEPDEKSTDEPPTQKTTTFPESKPVVPKAEPGESCTDTPMEPDEKSTDEPPTQKTTTFPETKPVVPKAEPSESCTDTPMEPDEKSTDEPPTQKDPSQPKEASVDVPQAAESTEIPTDGPPTHAEK